MKVTIEEIKRLQKLSALSSSDEELQNLIKDFEGIAQFVDQICDANLDDINVKNKRVTIDDLRDDISEKSMNREEILQNAQNRNEEFFVVPKVVE